MRGGFHHDQPDAEDRVNAGYVKMDKDGGEGAEAISKAYRNVSISLRGEFGPLISPANSRSTLSPMGPTLRTPLSRRQLNPGFAEVFLQTRYADARKSFATFVRQWGAAHQCGGTATGGNLTADAYYVNDETAEVDGISSAKNKVSPTSVFRRAASVP